MEGNKEMYEILAERLDNVNYISRNTSICLIDNNLYEISNECYHELNSLYTKISPFIKNSQNSSLVFYDFEEYKSYSTHKHIKSEEDILKEINEKIENKKNLISLIQKYNFLIKEIKDKNNIYQFKENLFTIISLNKNLQIEYYICNNEKDEFNILSLKENIISLIKEKITGGYIYKNNKDNIIKIVGYWSLI